MAKRSYYKIMVKVDLPHYAYAYVPASNDEEAYERVDDFIHRADEDKQYLYEIDSKSRIMPIEDPDQIRWHRSKTLADYDDAVIEIMHPESL